MFDFQSISTDNHCTFFFFVAFLRLWLIRRITGVGLNGDYFIGQVLILVGDFSLLRMGLDTTLDLISIVISEIDMRGCLGSPEFEMNFK